MYNLTSEIKETQRLVDIFNGEVNLTLSDLDDRVSVDVNNTISNIVKSLNESINNLNHTNPYVILNLVDNSIDNEKELNGWKLNTLKGNINYTNTDIIILESGYYLFGYTIGSHYTDTSPSQGCISVNLSNTYAAWDCSPGRIVSGSVVVVFNLGDAISIIQYTGNIIIDGNPKYFWAIRI